MNEKYELGRPLPSGVQRAAALLKLGGNIGFWVQLVLGVLAAALLFLSAAGLLAQNKSTEGAAFSLFCATGGVLGLVVSIVFCFRYKKIADRMILADAAQRPKRSTTLQFIKGGLIANLVGMVLAILGAEAFVGVLWQKLSNLPQGAAVYDTSKLPTPNEILLVLANTHTILCHFVGIAIALWLLDRLSKS